MRAAAYEFLQVLIGIIGAAFFLLGQILQKIHPHTISHRITVGPYYWACVRKRRARGEDEWQEIDMQIGITPPDGHPYWVKHPVSPLTPYRPNLKEPKQ